MEMVQDLDPLALPKYSGIQFDCSRGKQVCTTNRPGPDAWTALLKALTDDFPLNTRHTYLFIDMHNVQLDTSRSRFREVQSMLPHFLGRHRRLTNAAFVHYS